MLEQYSQGIRAWRGRIEIDKSHKNRLGYQYSKPTLDSMQSYLEAIIFIISQIPCFP